jgi:hypothetical protein
MIASHNARGVFSSRISETPIHARASWEWHEQRRKLVRRSLKTSGILSKEVLITLKGHQLVALFCVTLTVSAGLRLL